MIWNKNRRFFNLYNKSLNIQAGFGSLIYFTSCFYSVKTVVNTYLNSYFLDTIKYFKVENILIDSSNKKFILKK